MTFIEQAATLEGTTPAPSSRTGQLRRTVGRFVRRQPLGAAGAVIIALLLALAVGRSAIAPYDPLQQSSDILDGPSVKHLFGTDQIGRDIFSRVIHGAWISLKVGIIAVTIGTLSGVILGMVSGYFGGVIDFIVQRALDVIMSFPGLILAIAIMAVLGSNLTNAMIAIGIVIMPSAARVVRGSTLAIKNEQYVEAARAIGCTHGRVLAQYVLPNVAAPIIVLITIQLGNAIITEASLSFLGLATRPPTPSWGSMLSGAGRVYMLQAPWIAIVPGVAISLSVLAFNLLGDALRDVLDPRLRRGIG
ncbi:MAG: ABC transporter permease [Dehalococcoidia bacterium]